MEVIRPLIYSDEDLIIKFTQKLGFIPVKEVCPLKEEDSKRDYFKKLINDMKKENPKIKENTYHAMKNLKELNSW